MGNVVQGKLSDSAETAKSLKIIITKPVIFVKTVKLRRIMSDILFMKLPAQVIYSILLCFVTFGISAEKNWRYPKVDQQGNHSENFSALGAKLSIITDKSRFERDEIIHLTMKIRNEGFYPLTFYLHTNPMKNFTFVARNRAGRSLPLKDAELYDKPADYRDPHFHNHTATEYHSRSITLQPGESLERIFKLQDLVETSGLSDEINKLTISGYFYPNPIQSPSLFLTSENKITLLLDRDKDIPPAHVMSPETVSEEEPGVSPREVVYLALSAEYTRNWAAYFKYLSLKDLIRDYPDYARIYMKSNDQKKSQTLSEFRKFLMGKGTHKLLRFQVLDDATHDTSADSAKVKVKAIRELDGFKRQFSYTYYLTRAQTYWQITGVESRLAE